LGLHETSDFKGISLDRGGSWSVFGGDSEREVRLDDSELEDSELDDSLEWVGDSGEGGEEEVIDKDFSRNGDPSSFGKDVEGTGGGIRMVFFWKCRRWRRGKN